MLVVVVVVVPLFYRPIVAVDLTFLRRSSVCAYSTCDVACIDKYKSSEKNLGKVFFFSFTTLVCLQTLHANMR